MVFDSRHLPQTKEGFPCYLLRACHPRLNLEMDDNDGEPSAAGVVGSHGGNDNDNRNVNNILTTGRKRFGFARVVPEEGKKRVNYGKGDARRIMEEAVSLCEAMTLGYEVVFHGRRRSFKSSSSIAEGVR